MGRSPSSPTCSEWRPKPNKKRDLLPSGFLCEFLQHNHQLNTHQSESLVCWVAQLSGIEADLGVKGERGILASMPSRAAFLSDPTHKVVFHYTRHPQFLDESNRNLAQYAGAQAAQTGFVHLHRGLTGQSPCLHRLF